MGKLADLLRYKEKVELVNPKNGEKIKTAWVRLLGDEDLQEAFKFARIVSAEKRASLRDENSDDYKNAAIQLAEQPREVLESLILASKENKFANDASAIVVREDLPEIESIASLPDAPTLEEQEIHDKEINAVNDKYVKAIEDFIETKMNEVRAEIKDYTDEQVLNQAQIDLSLIQPLQDFVAEMNAQKVYRGTYMDEACKTRGFDNVEEYKNADASIKEQLVAAYNSLEISSEDLKKS